MRTVFEVMAGDDDDEWCVVCKRRADYWVTLKAEDGQLNYFEIPCGHPWTDGTPPLTEDEWKQITLGILRISP